MVKIEVDYNKFKEFQTKLEMYLNILKLMIKSNVNLNSDDTKELNQIIFNINEELKKSML
jgi:hypothetical protein